jgi:methionine sulfoxide reductase heme-binding subunit
MTTALAGRIEGWRLTCTLAGLIAFGALAIVAAHDGDADGLRLAIRITARASFVLFGLAFTAAALARLLPGAWTRWQRRNRRYLGVSFAASHFVHLTLVVALARLDPALFAALTSPVTVISGAIAYLLIAAMTATSFDRTAAMIGPRAWRLLHTAGAYYIWLSFAVAFGRRAVHDPFYLPFAAAVVLVLAIRILGRVSARRLAAVPPVVQTAR